MYQGLDQAPINFRREGGRFSPDTRSKKIVLGASSQQSQQQVRKEHRAVEVRQRGKKERKDSQAGSSLRNLEWADAETSRLVFFP